MYSKTRNTLSALTAASMFVVAGWMFGHPVVATAPARSPIDLNVAVADTGAPAGMNSLSALRIRHASRMSLATPYFSFALTLPQRRTD